MGVFPPIFGNPHMIHVVKKQQPRCEVFVGGLPQEATTEAEPTWIPGWKLSEKMDIFRKYVLNVPPKKNRDICLWKRFQKEKHV